MEGGASGSNGQKRSWNEWGSEIPAKKSRVEASNIEEANFETNEEEEHKGFSLADLADWNDEDIPQEALQATMLEPDIQMETREEQEEAEVQQATAAEVEEEPEPETASKASSSWHAEDASKVQEDANTAEAAGDQDDEQWEDEAPDAEWWDRKKKIIKKAKDEQSWWKEPKDKGKGKGKVKKSADDGWWVNGKFIKNDSWKNDQDSWANAASSKKWWDGSKSVEVDKGEKSWTKKKWEEETKSTKYVLTKSNLTWQEEEKGDKQWKKKKSDSWQDAEKPPIGAKKSTWNKSANEKAFKWEDNEKASKWEKNDKASKWEETNDSTTVKPPKGWRTKEMHRIYQLTYQQWIAEQVDMLTGRAQRSQNPLSTDTMSKLLSMPLRAQHEILRDVAGKPSAGKDAFAAEVASRLEESEKYSEKARWLEVVKSAVGSSKAQKVPKVPPKVPKPPSVPPPKGIPRVVPHRSSPSGQASAVVVGAAKRQADKKASAAAKKAADGPKPPQGPPPASLQGKVHSVPELHRVTGSPQAGLQKVPIPKNRPLVPKGQGFIHKLAKLPLAKLPSPPGAPAGPVNVQKSNWPAVWRMRQFKIEPKMPKPPPIVAQTLKQANDPKAAGRYVMANT